MARGEFETIAALFVPLARGNKAALGLADDAACIAQRAGRDLIVTADALVAGVHFFADDPPADIARKALRTNLSDLAAKGASPVGYFMTLARPKSFGDRAMAAFARGLAADGRLFDIPLLGGDTTSTPGPLTVSITALGEVAHGAMLRRDGGEAGDDIWVSGTIGDGALGLCAALGTLPRAMPARHKKALLGRYRIPQPRLALGTALAGKVHASLDVSDGLAADLGHLCKRSKVNADIDVAKVPLSAAAAAAVACDPALLETILTGGDDYELLFAAPVSKRAAVLRAAARAQTPVARIGHCTAGSGRVRFRDAAGGVRHFARAGFTHF
jgi:thiamine-monophosphate kinase